MHDAHQTTAGGAATPGDVRAAIDGDIGKGLTHILARIDANARFIARGAPHREALMEDTARVLAHLAATGNLPAAQTMYRYLQEGAADSYHDDPALFDTLVRLGCWKPGLRLLDLGAGPGNLVRAVRAAGGDAAGIDLSPSFVSHNEHLRVGLIDTPEPALLGVPADAHYDTVVSCLTLDRVSHPLQLLRNMARLAGPAGTLALITLLPLIPEDDERVGTRIVYTLPENRLSTPGTAEGDAAALRRIVEEACGRPAEVERIRYSVRTATGERTYDNVYAFVVRPAAADTPREMTARKSS